MQKIIITDFSDHETSQGLRGEISRHLSACPACREFEMKVRTKLIQPFESVVLRAPAGMWDAIQDRILHEPARWYSMFLPTAVSLPKMAFAAALILMLAGGAKVVYQQKNIFQHEAAVCVLENMNYMESLSSDETNESSEVEELI
jgi:hypothetical protein